MKKLIILVFFAVFWGGRSTKLLRLYSGNSFKICSHILMCFEGKVELWFWIRRNRKWTEKASGFVVLSSVTLISR